MRKLFLSLAVIGITSAVAIGATSAFFSDTETSSANTFAAGSLDLKLDNGDQNVVKFTLANLRPGNQPTGYYMLKNAGSLNGKLSLSNITVVDNENGITDPEQKAGDTTDTQGELSSVLNVRIYVDNDKDGYFSTGDNMFYNGLVKDLPTSFSDLVVNKTLAPNAEARINFVFDWWNTSIDNQAQGDSFVMGLAFTLEQ
jgi:predicted ribosomally synthesized peptide with SipW-like signal peptide